MNNPFPFCAGYAFALSLLILSYHVSPALVNLFVAQPVTLGSHTTVWMNWHAIGCAFVGLVNVQALYWNDARARRGIAIATAGIFGIWCAQNFMYTLTPLFTPAMWLHVVGCGLAALLSAAFVLRPEVADNSARRI